MSPWQINHLGKAVMRGAVIAYPTDTIWGFGCHPLYADSVYRILDIKNRPVDKGLILLSSHLSLLMPYLSRNLNKSQIDQLEQKTAHPTTWLVEASKDCPKWLRGRFSTIAIRITDHPFVDSLCETIQSPIVSTSANRSGKPTVRNAIQAQRQFAGEINAIVHGFATGASQASEIKSLATGERIRA